MRSALVRTLLLLSVAAFAVSVGSGQPPTVPIPVEPITDPFDPAEVPKQPKVSVKIPPTPYDYKGYTAFPDLKPPTREHKREPNGMVTVEEKGVVPLPPLPVLADDAPPLRKVQYARVQAGLSYLYRVKQLEQIIGRNSDSERNITIAAEVYSAAAELEDTPAKRVPWYQARVRSLKDAEEYIKQRVQVGTAGPQQLDYATFARLDAEADLLKLKTEAEPTIAPTVFVPVGCEPPSRLFRRR